LWPRATLGVATALSAVAANQAPPKSTKSQAAAHVRKAIAYEK
jgi:hypothetical protein